jgi:alkylhydroperoxidase/carboxymuconolactone decarboxylase family protein YurZ
MAPKTAALVLVAATVLVGAVGYLVLSAVSSENTATTNSGGCIPVHSSECANNGATRAAPGELIAYQLDR